MSNYVNSFQRLLALLHFGFQDVMNEGVFQRSPDAVQLYHGYVSFGLLLLLKAFYDFCRIFFVPLIILIFLYGVFIHADCIIRAQVDASRIGKFQKTVLKKELFYMSLCILVVHIFFSKHVYDFCSMFNFIFLRKFSSSVNIVEVVWMMINFDITCKFLAVYMKILIILIPGSYVNQHGTLCYFVEHFLVFAKCILVAQPWLYYFYYSYSGYEKLLGFAFCVGYVVLKIPVTVYNFKDLVAYSSRLLKLNQKLEILDDMDVKKNCIICLKKYALPKVALLCKHTFCKKCFLSWCFVKDTCPLCGENFRIKFHIFAYDNGGTNYFIQFF